MARISEIHYSNAHASSTGVGEFFEVALSPGEDPADFFVSTYNEDGTVNLDIALTTAGITSSVDPDSGETNYVIDGATFGFLLTDPDGGATRPYRPKAVKTARIQNICEHHDIWGGLRQSRDTSGRLRERAKYCL